ncbi:MAG: halocyanin domain-containing protein [Haloarculaceae archaeon]
MTDDSGVSRRGFMRAAAGSTAVAATAGTAQAQDSGSGGQPDYGGWLDQTSNFDGSTADKRGSKEVTIHVGADGNGGSFAFDPPAVWIDTGTKVTWKWTGNGGGHNVHAMEGGDFSSQIQSSSGATFEHTFDSGGIVKYQCDPHASLGMKGAIAVGGDVPTKGGGGGGGAAAGPPQIPDSAKTLGIASTIALGSTLGLAYFFIKYGGDYQTD